MSDGKQVGIAVMTRNNQLVIEFSREVGYMEMKPEQAVDFAKAILDKVMTIDPRATGSNIILPGQMH